MKQVTSVPDWATCMVSNYREQCQIPESITDLALYNGIEETSVCQFDEVQDQIDILRDHFDLEDEQQEETCKHINYTCTGVMDFNFNICDDCSYQWKA